MNRYKIPRVLAFLAQALVVGSAVAADQPGAGPAYEAIGKVPVMHAGRVKPFDTVAREEVKQVYGRESIKLGDPAAEIALFLDSKSQSAKPKSNEPARWGPVGAFLGWLVAPEYWDDQPFILVDYLPLRRRIVADSLATRLTAIAAKSTTPAGEKTTLEKLAADPAPTSKELAEFLASSQLPLEDKKTVAELAAKLSEEHKWLTPRELDEARVRVKDRVVPFLDWAAELDSQQRRFTANPESAPRLTEVERRAVEVAMRHASYKAYSGGQIQSNGVVLIMPRPSSDRYLADSLRAIKIAREKRGDMSNTPLMSMEELKSISTFWNDIPRDDRKDPTEDAAFDARYKAWLRDNSVWTPLLVLLKSKPYEMTAAGYPEAETAAFLAAYHVVEEAESSYPGHIPAEVGARFLTTARALGEAVNPEKYPTVATIERETHFNSMNPFWQAPFAYGLALTLLAIALHFTGVMSTRTFSGFLGSTIYRLGLTALLCGIGLEVYGFSLRVRISGWAPVTNMYETVIWVALVAAVLSFILELIFRRVYVALAGSGVALLGTITAANVPLLDPSIKSLQPVLRSNLWLTIHVLTEVSSYAAFGLAWMLGLIASAIYLTTTYRRSPKLLELATPLIPGLPLLLVGGGGVAASYGMLGPAWNVSQSLGASNDGLFYACAILGLLGGMASLAAMFAMAGELIDRALSASRARALAATPLSPSMAKLSPRELAMQHTAQKVKPLSNFIYRTMQVGVLLVAAGTILGGVWADYSWGRFWGWDPKEVWALITLLVYLIPLHGRFAGWISSFSLVVASVVCYLSVIMAWYGVNFVLGVGLHTYGFNEGGYQGSMSVILAAVMSFPLAAAWRRRLGQGPAATPSRAATPAADRPSPVLGPQA